MSYRLLATAIAIAVAVAFVAPVVVKLRDVPLAVVILIGIVLIILDARASLRGKDD